MLIRRVSIAPLGLLAIGLSTLLTACSPEPSESDKVATLVKNASHDRVSGKLDAAFMSIKEACVQMTEHPEYKDSSHALLIKQTYEEAIEVAESYTLIGRFGSASELLLAAANLESASGVSPNDPNSASQKMRKVKEAANQETEIVHEVQSASTFAEIPQRAEKSEKILTLLNSQKFQEAEKLARIETAELKHNVDYTSSSAYRRVFDLLVHACTAQGHYSDAIKELEGDLEIQKRGFDPQDLNSMDAGLFPKANNYARDLTTLAYVYYRAGDFEKALDAVNKAEPVTRRIVKKKDLQAVLIQKAKILHAKEDWHQALKYFKEARALGLQDNSPVDDAEILKNIAIDLGKAGQLGESLNARAQLINSPTYFFGRAVFLVESAAVARTAGDKATCKDWLAKAAKIAETRTNPGPYFNALGHYHREFLEYDEAIKAYSSAVHAFQKQGPTWRGQLADSNIWLARMYMKKKEYQKALRAIESAIDGTSTKIAGGQCPRLNAMCNYAEMTYDAGLCNEGAKRMDDALSYMEKLPTPPKNTPVIYIGAIERAIANEEPTNNSRSHELSTRALAIFSKTKVPPAEVAKFKLQVGLLYFNKLRDTEAETYFQDALKDCQSAKEESAAQIAPTASECRKYLSTIEKRKTGN